MEDSDEDSSASTSSITSGENRIFKPQALPLILDLHDIRKDDPSVPSLKTSDAVPATGATSVKIKKHKKAVKKKTVPGAKNNSSVSGASAPAATEVKEEFYDAHESYHAIPENQALAAALITQTENVQDPAKAPEQAVTSQPRTTKAAAGKGPSPIRKSTAPP